MELAAKPLTGTLWKKCKHLIIDEISMVDGKYFEKIERVIILQFTYSLEAGNWGFRWLVKYVAMTNRLEAFS